MTDETRQKPTFELIQELYEWIPKHWRAQIELDIELNDLLEDEHKVEVPNTLDRKRRRKVKPERMSTAEGARVRDRIASLYAHISSIGVQYSGVGSKAASGSERTELALNEVLDILNPPIDPPMVTDRLNMVGLGRCASLIVPETYYYADYPKVEDYKGDYEKWDMAYSDWTTTGPVPVCWKALAPEQTFPASFGRLGEEHLTWMQMPAFELRDMFSQEEIAGAMGRHQEREKHYDMDDVTLGIYANREYLAYCLLPGALGEGNTVGNGMLRCVEHGMGVPPIRIMSGMTSHNKTPGKYWLSVLHPVRKLIVAADKRLSEAATGSKMNALPWMKAWMKDRNVIGEGSEQDDELWREGDVTLLDPEMEGEGKEDILPVYQPQFGEKTFELVAWTLARIERMTGAVEALEGTFGPPGQPAWSRQHSVDQAVRQLAPLTQRVVASDLDAAERVIRALGVHGEEFSITPKGKNKPSFKVKPKELEAYIPILRSEYKVQSASNKRADYDLAVTLMERVIRGGLPGPSPTRVMDEFMEIEQPLDELKETKTWQLLLSPAADAFLQQWMLKEADMDLTADDGMGVEQVMALVQQGKLNPAFAQDLIMRATGGTGVAPTGDASRNGNNPVGPTPTTVGAVRASAPFQSEAGGPRPSPTEGGYRRDT